MEKEIAHKIASALEFSCPFVMHVQREHLSTITASQNVIKGTVLRLMEEWNCIPAMVLLDN